MTFRLYSDSLLSKWGFRDGELLGDFHYDYSSPDGPSASDILVAAVQKYLVPKIEQRIEVAEIVGHNPIRAIVVDGREVDYTKPNRDIVLTPEFVDVTEQDLIALFPDQLWDRGEHR